MFALLPLYERGSSRSVDGLHEARWERWKRWEEITDQSTLLDDRERSVLNEITLLIRIWSTIWARVTESRGHFMRFMELARKVGCNWIETAIILQWEECSYGCKTIADWYENTSNSKWDHPFCNVILFFLLWIRESVTDIARIGISGI
jgi:hypothetical protein